MQFYKLSELPANLHELSGATQLEEGEGKGQYKVLQDNPSLY